MTVFYILGLISAFFISLGFILYVSSIIKKKTLPSRMTWAILSGLSIVILLSNYELNALDSLWALLANAIGSTIIFILSLKFGTGGWDKNDKIAFFGLSFSLILLFLINNPFISLLIALSFDLWGLYPTIKKVQKYPKTEEILPWVVTVIGTIFNVLALDILNINKMQLEISISPIYFLIINSIVLYYIIKPKFY